MKEAAGNLEFEEAARLRDEIRRLEASELGVKMAPTARARPAPSTSASRPSRPAPAPSASPGPPPARRLRPAVACPIASAFAGLSTDCAGV